MTTLYQAGHECRTRAAFSGDWTTFSTEWTKGQETIYKSALISIAAAEHSPMG